MNALTAGSPVRSLDCLETEISTLSAELDALTYRFLLLLREFDEREGWRACGCTDCAQWLNYRCGIALGTARDRVRLARALKPLPAVSSALASGELSYSKARALTRIATPDNEAALVEYALGVTADAVEQRVRELRYGDSAQSSALAQQAYLGRALRCWTDAYGVMHIEVRLPEEMGALFAKALEMLADAQGESGIPAVGDFQARQADALVEMARRSLGGDGTERLSDDHQVLVHVDESALRGAGGRSDLPAESVRRLTCDGALVAVIENGAGEPLAVGRRRRTVPRAIKRALLARDRRCAFPGCHHGRYLDAHHIEHWADGGETEIDNLMLLCGHHHRLVHEAGFSIRRDHAGEWFFLRPNGRALPSSGMLSRRVSAETQRGCAPGG